MNYRGAGNIEINERKFYLEEIYHMFRDGRIHCPMGVLRPKEKMKKELVQLLDAVWMGIPLPAVYVSELQNGDFLVLEKNDNLWKLLWFLEGRYTIDYWMEERVIPHCDIQMIRSNEPRLARALYDTLISLQIIDYRTPKYLHMSIGKFVENWNVTREQSIREILYDSYEIWILDHVAKEIKQALGHGYWHNTSYINKYRTMYMLMYWFVYTKLWRDDVEMQEQLLLEETIISIEMEEHRIDDFLEATHYFSDDIFYMLERILDRVSTNFRKSIWDKYLGLLICFMDMAKQRRIGREHVNHMLVECGMFYEICHRLDSHQLTNHSIELAMQEWEREL